MSEGFHELYEETGEGPALTPDLETVYEQLQDDGAHWREDVPIMPSLDGLARELTHAILRPETDSPEALRERPGHISGLDITYGNGRSGMGKSRWSGVVSLAAMLLVVGLLVAVFQVRGGERSPVASGDHKTPTVTAPANSGWKTLPALAYNSERPDDSGPAVAPSNPQVIYEANAGRDWTAADGPQFLRRTDDAGATWRNLPFPVPAGRVHAAGFLVSALDPHTVILQILDDTLSDCPASFLVNSPGTYPMCDLQYFSSDGGAYWTLLRTPMSTLSPLYGASYYGNAVLQNQGTRLYAEVSCPSASCSRLVVSADGGHTWRIVDQQLYAAAPFTCDYVTAAASPAIFAVTANMNCAYSFRQPQAAFLLWRSDDGGTTWNRVATLPTQDLMGLLAVDSGNAAQPLLYAYMPKTLSVSTNKANLQEINPSDQARDIYCSTDGGHSWIAAPELGLPAGYIPFHAPVAVLTDGTIIATFNTQGTLGPNQDLNGSTLYGWKLGDSAWHQIAPPLTEELMNLSVQPGSGGDILWVFEMNFNEGSIDSYTAQRIQVPAHSG